MTNCERCPKWKQTETETQVERVIIPGVGEKNLCPLHNPWVEKDKMPEQTLVWRKDPHMQGAR